jgi:hypothetical protein
MDSVETLNSMRNVATATKAFYDQLVDEGFEKADALRLTMAWVGGMAGGKIS